MALTAQQLSPFVLAQFAAESYLDGVVGGSPELLSRRLQLGSNNFAFVGDTNEVSRDVTLTGYTRLTDAQVTQFVERYEVVDHLPNTITGFSATLLWDRLDNRYVLSFRSTEYPNEDQGGDWRRDGLDGADGEISNFGFAYAQIADMEAYYRQIVKSLITDSATGAVKDFIVTGYSLSGHLATVFAEAHQTDPGFVRAYTFNAPGHAAISGDMAALVNEAYQALSAPGVDALLRSGASGESIYNADNFYTAANGIRAALQTFAGNPSGVNITTEGVAQNLAGGKIVQVFGQADTNDATWVANSGVHSSNKVEVFIEDQPDVQGLGPITVLDGLTGVRSDFGTTHSITLLADTLMVMTTLQKLMPQLTLEATKTIFSAGSNERGMGFLGIQGQAESDSLERVVESLLNILEMDGLRKFLSNSGINTPDGRLPRGLAGSGFGNLSNRNIFHEALKAIGEKAGTSGNYTIELLAGKPAVDMVSAAEATDGRGMAYRYALKIGNAFALIRDTALYAMHNTGGELDLYDSASHSGALTKDWIKDRADYLERVNYYNAQNARYDLTKNSGNPGILGDAIATQYNNENLIWQDLEANITIKRGSETGMTAYRVFGSDSADVLNGGNNADRLYGGGGTDYLVGKGGNDYLEGGTGFDAYQFSALDGPDTLLDGDGRGVLTRNGKGIAVGVKQDDAHWSGAGVSYAKDGTNLEITFSDNAIDKVTIKDFDFAKAGATNYLGIRLIDAPVRPQISEPVHNGDQQPDKNDSFTGTALAEAFFTGEGEDEVYADGTEGSAAVSGGADLIEAGTGRDIVVAGGGNDWVEGGSEGDLIKGDYGNDTLYADTSTTDTSVLTVGAAIAIGETAVAVNGVGDLVAAGVGNDVMIGANTNDLILGGAGVDVIVGGGGDDTIYSDDELNSASFEWTVTRTVPTGGGAATYSVAVNNASVTRSPVAGALDVIYGGAGNDWAFAGGGDDYVDGGGGEDVLFGEGGSDVLMGGAEKDVLIGDNPGVVVGADEGADYLDGGAGDDILQGNGGADVLIGGRGVDTLSGGAGKDIYVFNKGDGIETVFDTPADANDPEASVLALGDGISRDNIKFRTGSLLVDLGEGDAIHFEGFDQLNPANTPVVGEILFADGASMSYADILAQGFDIDGTEESDDNHDLAHPQLVGTGVTDRIRGLGGNDVLAGLAGNDELDGGAGNDQLQGGDGDDVLDGGGGKDVLFGGAGNDTLIGSVDEDTLLGDVGGDVYHVDFFDTIFDTEGNNQIAFGDGVTADNLQVDDVVITGQHQLLITRLDDPISGRGLIITSGSLTHQNFDYAFADGKILNHQEFLGTSYRVAQNFAGTAGNDVVAGYGGNDAISGGAGNDILLGNSGNDSLVGEDGDDILSGGNGADSISGSAGADVLTGGAGDDTLSGGADADVYTFNYGDGKDTLTDGGVDGSDIIQFAQEILPADVTITRQANGDLRLALNGTPDGITVQGWYTQSENRIEQIVFGDGSQLLTADLLALTVPPITGTSGDDTLTGTDFNDSLLGLSGNDTLDGGLGNDTLEGGAGNDTYTLGWGAGKDTIVESPGETNTISLAPVMTFDDLAATRVEDDLFLRTRGTESGLMLKDYYTQSQNWQVQTSGGEAKNLTELLTPTTPADPVATLWEDAKAQFKAQYYSDAQRFGKQLFSDGTVRQAASRYGFIFNGQYITADPAGTISVNLPLGTGANQSIAQLIVNQAQSDAAVQSWDGVSFSTTSAQVTLNVEWDKKEVSRDTSFHGTVLDFEGNSHTLYRTTFNGLISGVVTGITPGSTSGALSPGQVVQGVAIPGGLNVNSQSVATTLSAQSTTDIVNEIYAGLSDNLIFSDFGFVDGGPGNDQIEGFGNYGDEVVNNFLSGGSGDDRLTGWFSTDVLTGGPGSDILQGLFGGDTYFVNPADDGVDIINEVYHAERFGVIDDDPATDADTVLFGAGVALEDLALSFGSMAITQFGGTVTIFPTLDASWAENHGIRVLIAGPAYPNGVEMGMGIERFQFDDGTTVSFQDVLSRVPVSLLAGTAVNDILVGGPGNDEIHGFSGDDSIDGFTGDDILDGGTGNDVLRGGTGADTYRIVRGDGQDVITDVDTNDGNVDRVLYAADILPSQVKATRLGNDLILTLTGTTDRVTVSNDLENDGATFSLIEQVEFLADGTVWDLDTIKTLVLTGTGGNDIILGYSTDDVLSGFDGNDTLTGKAGNDVLIGGTGNDVLQGGTGNDTYRFVRGDGQDTITDGGDPAEMDILHLEDLALTDVAIFRAANGDLRISLNDLSGGVTVTGYYNIPANRIERIEFNDDSVVDSLMLDALTVVPITGTAGNDVLVGTEFDDILLGLGGDDVISGGSGADTLSGGAGNDVLKGEIGNDVYQYAAGDGQDTIVDLDATAGNIDRIQFAADISFSQVKASRSGNDLILSLTGTTGQITVTAYFQNESVTSAVERIEFLADGTVWDVSTIRSLVITPTDGDDLIIGYSSADLLTGLGGNDTLIGGAGADALDGGHGNDNLQGDSGDDSYLISRGDGQDTILDRDVPFPNADKLIYSADILPSQVRATRADNDLVLQLTDADDRITISNYFVPFGFVLSPPAPGFPPVPMILPSFEVEQIQFLSDATVWNPNIVKSLVITPTSGDDFIVGYSTNDNLTGLGGNDTLKGAEGSDTLDGGPGNDILYGQSGSDTYLFARGGGHDIIVNGEADTAGTTDTLSFAADIAPVQVAVTKSSNDLVLSIVGTEDRVQLRDYFAGGLALVEGIRFADGTVWNAGDIQARLPVAIPGTPADDVLSGTAGADALSGGAGNDLLDGGAGDDIYLYNPGDAVDTIQDSQGTDTVVFGSGITSDMLTLGLGSLLIRVGNSSDAIHIQGFDPGDVYASPVIESFSFSNGTVLTYGDLLARGFDLIGTAGNDFITGTNIVDRIHGLAGEDTLAGGAGSDTYLFGPGSGSDLIEDSAGDLDTIVLGDGITEEAVTVSRSGSLINLRIDGTADELGIHQEEGTGFLIERVQFADGTIWDAATLESKSTIANTPPLLSTLLADQAATEEEAFVFGVSSSFIDPDDTLSYTATLANGSPLPAWLVLDIARGELSGTPGNDDVGGFDLTVTATDTRGLSASDTFHVAVANTNDAPVLAQPLLHQTVLEDAAFSFSLPRNTFSDVDVGDGLMLSVGQVGGAALPAWLGFDAASGTFGGTPTNDNVGTLALEVTATDSAGATATDVFDLTVENVNDAPQLVTPLSDQSGNQNAPFTFQVPHATFADVDAGDSLVLSATFSDGTPLPGWLAFDAASGSFSGTPTDQDIGLFELQVTATDQAGAAAAANFDLFISDAAVSDTSYTGTNHGDSIVTGFENDVIDARQGTDTVLSGAGRDLVLGGQSNDTISGEAGNDILSGGLGDDALDGGTGNDALLGEQGVDTLNGGSGSDLLVGGSGNDTIDTGSGDNIVSFNRGDGADIVYSDAFSQNTLSLGGGIQYDDLALSKNGNDLVLELGGEESITLKDWYADSSNQTFLKLQIMIDEIGDFDPESEDPLHNQRVQTFDFLDLVNQFDQTRVADSYLEHWLMMDRLLNAHLAASNSAALGGDLAYYYGVNGTLSGIGLNAAQQVISAPGFGRDAQSLRPFTGLQDGLTILA